MYRYGFLFCKSALPKFELDYVTKSPDFLEQANLIMDQGHGIEDVDIYNIVKDICFQMLEKRFADGFKDDYIATHGEEAYDEFRKKSIRFLKATKRFSKAIYGYDKWREDYEEFLKREGE